MYVYHKSVIRREKLLAAIRFAIQRAAEENQMVLFTVQLRVLVQVQGDSNANAIYRETVRSLCGYTRRRIVGPHLRANTAKQLARDERIWRHQKRFGTLAISCHAPNVEGWEETLKDNMELAEYVATLPLLKVDEGKWEQAVKDMMADDFFGYHPDVVLYAMTWGRIMQAEMDRRQSSLTTEIFNATSSFMDKSMKPSGHSARRAELLLEETWQHGATLAEFTRQWRVQAA